jgi:hypothetical protein
MTKFVCVAPGRRAVTVTPLSFSSSRKLSAKEYTKAFVAA